MSVAQATLRRERPGMVHTYLGMLLFLVSESFLFGSLFWAYFYIRGRSLPNWPPQGIELGMTLVSINTVILLASSVSLYWGIRAIRRGNLAGLITGLIVTIVLGSTFLFNTGWEWTHASFRPWSHAYGSLFYTLTGFHGLHVLAGILLLFVLLIRAVRRRTSAQRYLALEVGSLYWHFVDLVWLFVFTALFLIR